MMGTEMVPKMSVTLNQLTWLIAREDFIKVMSVANNEVYPYNKAEKGEENILQVFMN
jgi:hypothetical protein